MIRKSRKAQDGQSDHTSDIYEDLEELTAQSPAELSACVGGSQVYSPTHGLSKNLQEATGAGAITNQVNFITNELHDGISHAETIGQSWSQFQNGSGQSDMETDATKISDECVKDLKGYLESTHDVLSSQGVYQYIENVKSQIDNDAGIYNFSRNLSAGDIAQAWQDHESAGQPATPSDFTSENSPGMNHLELNSANTTSVQIQSQVQAIESTLHSDLSSSSENEGFADNAVTIENAACDNLERVLEHSGHVLDANGIASFVSYVQNDVETQESPVSVSSAGLNTFALANSASKFEHADNLIISDMESSLQHDYQSVQGTINAEGTSYNTQQLDNQVLNAETQFAEKHLSITANNEATILQSIEQKDGITLATQSTEIESQIEKDYHSASFIMADKLSSSDIVNSVESFVEQKGDTVYLQNIQNVVEYVESDDGVALGLQAKSDYEAFSLQAAINGISAPPAQQIINDLESAVASGTSFSQSEQHLTEAYNSIIGGQAPQASLQLNGDLQQVTGTKSDPVYVVETEGWQTIYSQSTDGEDYPNAPLVTTTTVVPAASFIEVADTTDPVQDNSVIHQLQTQITNIESAIENQYSGVSAVDRSEVAQLVQQDMSQLQDVLKPTISNSTPSQLSYSTNYRSWMSNDLTTDNPGISNAGFTIGSETYSSTGEILSQSGMKDVENQIETAIKQQIGVTSEALSQSGAGQVSMDNGIDLQTAADYNVTNTSSNIAHEQGQMQSLVDMIDQGYSGQLSATMMSQVKDIVATEANGVLNSLESAQFEGNETILSQTGKAEFVAEVNADIKNALAQEGVNVQEFNPTEANWQSQAGDSMSVAENVRQAETEFSNIQTDLDAKYSSTQAAVNYINQFLLPEDEQINASNGVDQITMHTMTYQQAESFKSNIESIVDKDFGVTPESNLIATIEADALGSNSTTPSLVQEVDAQATQYVHLYEENNLQALPNAIAAAEKIDARDNLQTYLTPTSDPNYQNDLKAQERQEATAVTNALRTAAHQEGTTLEQALGGDIGGPDVSPSDLEAMFIDPTVGSAEAAAIKANGGALLTSAEEAKAESQAVNSIENSVEWQSN